MVNTAHGTREEPSGHNNSLQFIQKIHQDAWVGLHLLPEVLVLADLLVSPDPSQGDLPEVEDLMALSQ